MVKLNYGIGREYLKDWTLTDALREIYQNFLDYGLYFEEVKPVNSDLVYVKLSSSYEPKDLSFLKIGKSLKEGEAIGKHGEGLKMALLIFLRNDLPIAIRTPDFKIVPIWDNQKHIGESLAIEVKDRPTDIPIIRKWKISKDIEKYDEELINFDISFICNSDIWINFTRNVIKPEDKLFTVDYYGSIVNKEKGNIYSGGLFVCNLPKLSKAYDIKPSQLSLDRDRRIPGSFDINWNTSKILDAYEKEQARFNFVDQDYDDHSYRDIPTEKFSSIKPKEVAGKVEFFAKVVNEETKQEEEILITNHRYKEQLKSSSFFSNAINKIKSFIASALGIDALLIAFMNRHCNTPESKADFKIILERLNIKIGG